MPADPHITAIAAKVVEKTQKRLPADVRVLAQKIPVHYQDYAGQDLVEQGLDPGILGLFDGDPHGLEGSNTHPFPPQIILFLESIADYVEDDLDAFRDEVRLTYLHELGHYLGWDEDEVASRGLE
jgi:predicted Zn-dependent protease with MMP-like domain